MILYPQPGFVTQSDLTLEKQLPVMISDPVCADVLVLVFEAWVLQQGKTPAWLLYYLVYYQTDRLSHDCDGCFEILKSINQVQQPLFYRAGKMCANLIDKITWLLKYHWPSLQILDIHLKTLAVKQSTVMTIPYVFMHSRLVLGDHYYVSNHNIQINAAVDHVTELRCCHKVIEWIKAAIIDDMLVEPQIDLTVKVRSPPRLTLGHSLYGVLKTDD